MIFLKQYSIYLKNNEKKGFKMTTKNKKSIASQALMEMESIKEAIKNEKENSLKTLLGEAVKKALREGCDEEEDDDYEINKDDEKAPKGGKKKSGKTANEDATDDEMYANAQQQNAEYANAQAEGQGMQPQGGAQEAPETGAAMQGQEGEGDGEWDEFSDYQVGDNTYDLTGEKDYDKVVKVYKLLNDEDNVIVKKDGDTLQLKDNEAGTEYVIDLGGDEGGKPEYSEEGQELNEGNEYEIDLGDFGKKGPKDDSFIEDADFEEIPDEEPYDDFGETDDEGFDDFEYLPDEEGDNSVAGFPSEMNEHKKTRKPMKENKEVIFEVDLGYTDNYQDKDPIAGLSNNEPSKGGKSWHNGLPTGTEKPWAGSSKDKGEPFKQQVDEEDELGLDDTMEEGATTVSTQPMQKQTLQHVPNERQLRQGYKQIHDAQGPVSESKELKSIKKENKELKNAIIELRKNLNEAYLTNVNLGKITKLFLENATTESEKVDIINRFSNEAKTIEQSKALYESINRELKSTKKSVNLNESSVTANGTKKLNEEKIYKSNDLLKTIDLMNRVENM